MSRSGYVDDYEGLNLYRGAVLQALRGRRGQAFLRELLAALDALPAPRLIAHELIACGGEVCALGAAGLQRGLDMATIDDYDSECVAEAFGIAHAMAAEIAYVNDEQGNSRETPEERFARVRRWVVGQIERPHA